MKKIVLTVEIIDGGEIIGDKENVAAALERFGTVRILQVQEVHRREKQQEMEQCSFWENSLKGTPYEGKIKRFW